MWWLDFLKIPMKIKQFGTKQVLPTSSCPSGDSDSCQACLAFLSLSYLVKLVLFCQDCLFSCLFKLVMSCLNLIFCCLVKLVLSCLFLSHLFGLGMSCQACLVLLYVKTKGWKFFRRLISIQLVQGANSMSISLLKNKD